MPTLMVMFPFKFYGPWIDPLTALLPGLTVRYYPDDAEPVDDVDYALVWRPEPGALKRFPNLKAVFSLGAGVDNVLSDPDYPRGVPLARAVDDGLTEGMTHYVVLHVLRHHRGQREYDAMQRRRHWEIRLTPEAKDSPVGFLGFGVLGQAGAKALKGLGFPVAGWSRSAKSVPGIETFHGDKGLTPFLARTKILVCLLPLTRETEGILNADLFARLPQGASLINAARGRHLVEDDLIAALDSGQLSEATLDVFRTEPLPDDHPFWTHPKITVTPHVAAITQPAAIAALVAENITRVERGEGVLNPVDLDRGY